MLDKFKRAYLKTHEFPKYEPDAAMFAHGPDHAWLYQVRIGFLSWPHSDLIAFLTALDVEWFLSDKALSLQAWDETTRRLKVYDDGKILRSNLIPDLTGIW